MSKISEGYDCVHKVYLTHSYSINLLLVNFDKLAFNLKYLYDVFNLFVKALGDAFHHRHH